MKNKILGLLGKSFQVPGERKIASTIGSFSLAEKTIFGFFVAILFISSFGLLWQLNNEFIVEVPSHGGVLTEGIVGFPRFINPLLAISDSDKDLSAVVYSGLMKIDQGGHLVPDLAESYVISPDGKTYTFTLKEGLKFHNGDSLTSDDIVFTVTSVQNELLKSPKRPSWIGVQVEAPDDRTVVFNLKQAYAPFLENTTLGILPKKIWSNLDAEQFPFSQFNIEPVGSGPFRVTKIKRNDSGVANFYALKSFKDYAIGKPYLDGLNFQFYANENDLVRDYERGLVDSLSGISPQKVKEFDQSGKRVERIPLARVFGLFFNQNQAPVLGNKEVRQALVKSLDRSRLISEVLFGYGTAINSPFPPKVLSLETKKVERTLAEARTILEEAGWTLGDAGVWQKKTSKGTEELSFTISTAEAAELKKAAEIMKENFEELGARVDVKIFETGALNQTVIRPRKYDALLFGEIIGRDLDLFAFWHSSQRNDPGLNVSGYANVKSDKLLEEARTLSDEDDRLEKFSAFNDEISKDNPAVFAYSPDFLYLLPDKLKGFEMGTIAIPSERFGTISQWYIDTDKVWTFLAK